MPRLRPATSSASRARGSPAPRCSTSVLTGPSARPVLVDTAGSRPARRRIASWPANSSRQPRLPQVQAAPSGSRVVWPSSAGVPVGAPEQLAADDDAGPDPDLAGDVHVVAEGGPVPEPQLTEGGHVGLVLDQDRGAAAAPRRPAAGAAGRRSSRGWGRGPPCPSPGRPGRARPRRWPRWSGLRSRPRPPRPWRGGPAARPRPPGRRPGCRPPRRTGPGFTPGQVDHAGGQVVDVRPPAQPGQAVAGQGEGRARPAQVATALGALLDHQSRPSCSSVTMLDHRRLGQPGAAASWALVTGSRRPPRVEDQGPVPVAHLPRAQRQVTRWTGHGQRPSCGESSLLERSNRIPGVQSSHPATSRSFGPRTKVVPPLDGAVAGWDHLAAVARLGQELAMQDLRPTRDDKVQLRPVDGRLAGQRPVRRAPPGRR